MLRVQRLTRGRAVWSVLALAAPVVYHVMYLPVWGENALVNYSGFTNGFLLFQGVCFLLALAHLPLALFLPRRAWLDLPLDLIAAASLLWTGFTGLVFLLELADVQWLPVPT